MRQVEAGELVLAGVEHAELVEEPVVERPVVLELVRAERVRDALDGVALAVRPVVHRVDAPLVAGPVMRRVQDAVHHRIAQVQVRRRHVDLGPQHARAVRELALPHALEEVEVLLSGAIAMGAVPARVGQGAAIRADLVGALVVHVGGAGADQLLGPRVERREVVRRVVLVLPPLVPQPADVLLDRVGEMRLLLRRIGVVEAEVTDPAELLGHAEVEAEGLGVPDVEIAVGLRREAGHDPAVVLSGRDIVPDDRANEVERRFGHRRDCPLPAGSC
jgi:hypothetical protein